ncbi:MAG: hypothetical protein HRF52_10350 [Ignavibacterium sp.]|jgi:hypothetical protein|uniref:sialidase family protein n=1 Tax=Ignavibacterium sp. TaxID=2651167 RepID=UPI003297F9E1
MKLKTYIPLLALILQLLLFATSCKQSTEPPIIPPDEGVANTIVLTVEWTDLYRINVKWNRAKADTLEPFTYRLIQTDEQGNKTIKDFTNIILDTNYTAGVPDSLAQGKSYWFKVEGYNKENKLKDTSITVIGKTLSPTSHDIVWQIDTLGQPGNFLNDIWGLDENNVWAVGYVHLPDGESGIIKWNGIEWMSFPTSSGVKYGIFGFSQSNIFVVGESVNRGFIAIWNGNNWTEYRDDYFLSRGDTVYPLRAVWGSASNDVWAVGDFGTIIHWDGKEWKKIKSPLDLSLNDVWGTDANNVYILKTSVDNTSTVARYNGIYWEDLTDRIPAGPKNFNSIWIDKSGTGYVVGNSTLYFDGKSFNRVNINQSSYSVRIRGRNSADVIVSGQRGRVYHFNGLNWVNFPQLEDNSGNFSEISGIQIFKNKIFLVGKTLNRAITYIGTKQ